MPVQKTFLYLTKMGRGAVCPPKKEGREGDKMMWEWQKIKSNVSLTRGTLYFYPCRQYNYFNFERFWGFYM